VNDIILIDNNTKCLSLSLCSTRSFVFTSIEFFVLKIVCICVVLSCASDSTVNLWHSASQPSSNSSPLITSWSWHQDYVKVHSRLRTDHTLSHTKAHFIDFEFTFCFLVLGYDFVFVFQVVRYASEVNLAASASLDGLVHIWNPNSLIPSQSGPLRTLRTKKLSSIYSMAFNSKGSLLLTGSTDMVQNEILVLLIISVFLSLSLSLFVCRFLFLYSLFL
jgi:WD40 repeat protein